MAGLEEEKEEDLIDYLIVVSLFRQYDVLISMLATMAGADKAKELQQLHESGRFLFPPPFLEDGED